MGLTVWLPSSDQPDPLKPLKPHYILVLMFLKKKKKVKEHELSHGSIKSAQLKPKIKQAHRPSSIHIYMLSIFVESN